MSLSFEELSFEKLPHPVLEPEEEGFDSKNVYNPAVIKYRKKFVMLYRAEGKNDEVTGRIGLAISEDGVNFIRHPEPVLEPEYPWERIGVEDPRVVRVKGTYYMTYTGYDGRTARLCLATSKNLLNWKKLGPVFPEFPFKRNGIENWTKSGAILSERIRDGRFKGHYIMYFGDSNVWLALSKNLREWEYVAEPVIRPEGTLVEAGAPPLLTNDGILMFYNDADDDLVYRVRAALFDPEDPRRILRRSDYLLEPTFEWEREGWVPNVVFAESYADGLLYYGAADRRVGVTKLRGKSL